MTNVLKSSFYGQERLSVFTIRKIKEAYLEFLEVEKEAEKEVVKIMKKIRENCLFVGGNKVDNVCNMINMIIEDSEVFPVIQSKRVNPSIYQNVAAMLYSPEIDEYEDLKKLIEEDEINHYTLKYVLSSIKDVSEIVFIDFEHQITEVNHEEMPLTFNSSASLNGHDIFVENLFYHLSPQLLEDISVKQIVDMAKSFKTTGLYVYEFLVNFQNSPLMGLATIKRKEFTSAFDEEALLETLKNTARIKDLIKPEKEEQFKNDFQQYNILKEMREAIDLVIFSENEKKEAEEYYKTIEKAFGA